MLMLMLSIKLLSYCFLYLKIKLFVIEYYRKSNHLHFSGNALDYYEFYKMIEYFTIITMFKSVESIL